MAARRPRSQVWCMYRVESAGFALPRCPLTAKLQDTLGSWRGQQSSSFPKDCNLATRVLSERACPTETTSILSYPLRRRDGRGQTIWKHYIVPSQRGVTQSGEGRGARWNTDVSSAYLILAILPACDSLPRQKTSSFERELSMAACGSDYTTSTYQGGRWVDVPPDADLRSTQAIQVRCMRE